MKPTSQAFESIVDHIVSGALSLQEAVELIERTVISRALDATSGHRSEASKLLGIHRNTLQRKMAEYGLDSAVPRRKPPARSRPPVSRTRRKTL